MHQFRYKNRQLHCEEFRVSTLAQRYGTPLYIYSAATIEDHFRRLDATLAPLNHLICYAVKANSNLAILRFLGKLGSGFDIVSAGELYRVLNAGGNPRQCTFAGVGKTEPEIHYALRQGIYSFNVESLPELERIDRVAHSLKKTAPVAIRINPNVAAGGHHKISTGTYENKFGIALDDANEIYARAARLRHIRIAGVQMHIGSQITSAKPFADAVRRVLPFVLSLRDRFGLDFFSIGGGIGIVYDRALESGSPQWWTKKTGGTGVPASDEPLHLTLDQYASTLLPLLRPLQLRILVEPGRLLVGNAGILVTRVEFVKSTPEKTFVIVDAAMNDLIRPALYDAYHEIVPLKQSLLAPRSSLLADVVGPVCESGDCFAKARRLPPVGEGDYLALMSAGAYGFSMASNYNTRPRPAEILVRGKSAKLIRRRESIPDLIRGE